MLAAVTITRLEKAATDNGFDLDLEHTADWLSFGSSQTSMGIWLTVASESPGFVAAASRADVLDGVGGPRRGGYRPAPERRRRRAKSSATSPHSIACCAERSSSRARCPTGCFTSSRPKPRTCHGRRKPNA